MSVARRKLRITSHLLPVTADNIKCFSLKAALLSHDGRLARQEGDSLFYGGPPGKETVLSRLLCVATPHHCCAEPWPAEGEQRSGKNLGPPRANASAPSFFKNNISHYIHGYRGNLSRVVCEAFASQTRDKMWLNQIIWLLCSFNFSPEPFFSSRL